MELTGTQKTLLKVLKNYKVPTDEVVPMMVFLKDDEAGMKELTEYLTSSRRTPEELMDKSFDIIEKQ